MSKIGTIHMELEEQAAELGFESLEQATDAGCEVEWHKDSAELVEPLEAAHRAWEKERDDVLEGLNNLLNIYKDIRFLKPDLGIVKKAIKFIEEAHE